MKSSLRSVALYLTGFASLFLIWHIASTWLLPSVLFPTPAKVVLKAIELAGKRAELKENHPVVAALQSQYTQAREERD